jgi:hypothetical protein
MQYENARGAVDELLAKGFNEKEFNAIVQQSVVKANSLVPAGTAAVEITSRVGERTAHGLDWLVGGEHNVVIPDVGKVHAAGQMATIMSKTAMGPGKPDPGLRSALVEYSLPSDIAEAYTEGVMRGGVLFFVRAGDERAAEAANVLHEHKAKHVASYEG